MIDETSSLLIKNKEISKIWKEKNEINEILEDLIFEALYLKLFNNNEDIIAKSIEMNEKFKVLQNIINEDLLEIPKYCRITSILLHIQDGNKK